MLLYGSVELMLLHDSVASPLSVLVACCNPEGMGSVMRSLPAQMLEFQRISISSEGGEVGGTVSG